MRACEYICEYVYVCACACVRVCEWAAILPVSTSPIYPSIRLLSTRQHIFYPYIHAYLKIAFSGTKITKIRNTAKFSGTHQQMYPHIYEINPATRFYGKIEGQYTVHLPYRFRAAENAICRSRSTVCHFHHSTTVL